MLLLSLASVWAGEGMWLPEQLGEMPDREREVREAVVLQLANDDLQDGRVPERHERFGERHGVRREARALSAGQDDRPHTVYTCGR